MGPINYMQQVADPFASAMRGYQMGASIQEQQAHAQAQQLALQQKQQQVEQQRLLAEERARVFSNPAAATRDDVMRLGSMMDPKQSEELRKWWDSRDQETQKADLSFTSNVLTAAQNNPDLAATLMEDRAKAEKDPTRAKVWTDAARLVKIDPAAAQGGILSIVASLPGGENVVNAYYKSKEDKRAGAKETREQQMAGPLLAEAQARAKKLGVEAAAAPAVLQAQVSDIYANMQDRANRLGLDREKFESDLELEIEKLRSSGSKLPDSAVKIVNDSAAEAVMARQSAINATSLAEKFETLGGGLGAGATLAEKFAKITGSQDAMSMARTEYVRLVSSEAIKSLPPGPATDKDIELALKGFPPETADAKYIASFLRGTAKLQRRTEALATLRASWVDQVGSMGSARKDVEIDGIKVPKGANFIRFAKSALDDKEKAIAEEAQANIAKTRPYWQYGSK